MCYTIIVCSNTPITQSYPLVLYIFYIVNIWHHCEGVGVEKKAGAQWTPRSSVQCIEEGPRYCGYCPLRLYQYQAQSWESFWWQRKKDKYYQAILKKIDRIKNDTKSGRLNDLLNANKEIMGLKSKKMYAESLRIERVNPQYRGWKVTKRWWNQKLASWKTRGDVGGT